MGDQEPLGSLSTATSWRDGRTASPSPSLPRREREAPVARPLRIFLSAGEPSGDLHGANLIRQLHAQWPRLEAVGYGGPEMASAGCRLHADLTALAIMWFARAVANLPRFWDLVGRADRFFRHHRPDAVVLIDYPGFNWWIARRAKAHGIPVFYYVPPQIWAWAQWRVAKMRRLVDHVLCSLPFEEPWFRRHGVNATWVGHPLFDEICRQTPDAAFMEALRDRPGPLVVILPGSRNQEVANNLDILLKAARHVHQAVPQVRLAIAAFKAEQAQLARRHVARSGLMVDVFAARTPELVRLADCCMAVSGSVSLELLYHTKPAVIVYRIGRLAYRVQRRLRKVRYITLVNLLASPDPLCNDTRPCDIPQADGPDVLFPEYLTWEDKSAEMAGHVIRWLTEPAQREALVARLQQLKAQVGETGASARAAAYILHALSCPNHSAQGSDCRLCKSPNL